MLYENTDTRTHMNNDGHLSIQAETEMLLGYQKLTEKDPFLGTSGNRWFCEHIGPHLLVFRTVMQISIAFNHLHNCALLWQPQETGMVRELLIKLSLEIWTEWAGRMVTDYLLPWDKNVISCSDYWRESNGAYRTRVVAEGQSVGLYSSHGVMRYLWLIIEGL